MVIRRIVADLATDDIAATRAFYVDLLGMEVVMDQGWIVTLSSKASGAGHPPPQLSIMTQGGSGTPVPHLSIEVDDVDAVHHRAVAAGHEITYGITDEPWGVRRFFVKDPAGRILNILAHDVP